MAGVSCRARPEDETLPSVSMTPLPGRAAQYGPADGVWRENRESGLAAGYCPSFR